MAANNPKLNPSERDRYVRMSLKLRHVIDLIVEDPNTVVSEELFNINAESETNITAEEVKALPPTINDVQAVIDASIAATEVDPSSSEAKMRQRMQEKKTKAELDQGKLFDKNVNFGRSRVDFTIFSENERLAGYPNYCFHAPVHLIPLKQQHDPIVKRVLPMIEPDVSHQIFMDLDPHHLLVGSLKRYVSLRPGLPTLPPLTQLAQSEAASVGVSVANGNKRKIVE